MSSNSQVMLSNAKSNIVHLSNPKQLKLDTSKSSTDDTSSSSVYPKAEKQQLVAQLDYHIYFNNQHANNREIWHSDLRNVPSFQSLVFFALVFLLPKYFICHKMLFCLFGCTLLSALHYFYLLSNSIICHLLSSMLASSTSIWRDPSPLQDYIFLGRPLICFLPASKSLVVPDLAARNCMITEQRLLKVMMMTKTKTR